MRVLAAVAAAWAGAIWSGRKSARRRLLPPGPVRGRDVGGGLAGCAVLAALTLGRVPWWVLGLSAMGLGGVRVAVRRRAHRVRRQAGEADVVTLTYAVAAELRAGRSPAAALAAVAAHMRVLGPDLAAAARAVARGADLGTELTVVAGHAGCSRLRPVAAAWAATVAMGAGAADVLDRMGESFDADDRASEELAAMSAGPRATILVLGLLPIVGVALGSSLGLAPLHVLTGTRPGLGLVAAAAVLDGLGLAWVRRITSAALRP